MLYLYQIFIFLLGHLHFFLHFFFTFMENLFKKRPIQHGTSGPLKLQTSAKTKKEKKRKKWKKPKWKEEENEREKKLLNRWREQQLQRSWIVKTYRNHRVACCNDWELPRRHCIDIGDWGQWKQRETDNSHGNVYVLRKKSHQWECGDRKKRRERENKEIKTEREWGKKE